MYILHVFDFCVHFYRLGSENLPGKTDNFSPPATQPPDEDNNGKSGEESNANEEESVMEADMDAGVPPSKETSQLSPPDSSEVSMGKEECEERTFFSQQEEEEKMMEVESDEEMPAGVAKGSSHQCVLTDTSGK